MFDRLPFLVSVKHRKAFDSLISSSPVSQQSDLSQPWQETDIVERGGSVSKIKQRVKRQRGKMKGLFNL